MYAKEDNALSHNPEILSQSGKVGWKPLRITTSAPSIIRISMPVRWAIWTGIRSRTRSAASKAPGYFRWMRCHPVLSLPMMLSLGLL